MAKNRSDKSCFLSSYGGDWITAASMLAEMSCKRIGGEVELSSRFWMQKRWRDIFIREKTNAHKLLEEFSVKAIIKAWESKQGRKVQHLGVPFFKDIIKEEQHKIDLEAGKLEGAPIPELIDVTQKPRSGPKNKDNNQSIREKLN